MILLIRPLMRKVIRFFAPYFYDTYILIGDAGNLTIGKKVALSNCLINLSSGNVDVGDYSIFGQNVQLITGRHRYINGQRAGIDVVKTTESWGGGSIEVPSEGFDIEIGAQTWIASGAIVIGKVSIGNNAIICAGSIVTKDVNDFEIVAGCPAIVIGDTRSL